MKFLYIGDLHARSTSPKNRKDNWEETYANKILEIREIAKKHNVKAILHGGDFFSKHKYDTEFLAKVLNMWGHKNYNEKLLEEGVIVGGTNEAPIITPIGNHDLLGSSLKSYEKTSLCFLESIGFVTIANKERPLVFKENDFTVAITGGHYELDMDETKEPYLIYEKQGDYHIHIVHGMLTDHKWPDGVPHTTLDEVLHTKADLTIAGHDHKGFPLFEHEGKLFVNPGSPVRMGTDEIKRKPKVMLIEVDEDGIKTRYIYLKSAKPGDEVLDLTEKENKERKSNTLKDIKERIQENAKTGSSINDIIKSIAEDSNIDEAVAQSVIDKVADKINSSKTNKLDDGSSNNEYYYIKTLDLVNFGSHERTTFNFSDGLNVFIGATSSGKTTCFRALKWIYDDDGNSKRFIKKGENFCEATISTSHGYIITRFIHPKGKKTKVGKTVKNGYEITYPNGDIAVTNTKGVDLVRDILGYKKLNLENKEIDLNFLDQGSSWFFIGDKYTSTDRAKMIGAIHKTHFVDLAIKDLEADNKRLNQKRDDKVEEINKIQEKIEGFSYLEEMKVNLSIINEKKDKLINLIEIQNSLNEILGKRKLVEDEITKCDIIINNIEKVNIDDIKRKINALKEILEIYDKTSTLRDKILSVESDIKKYDSILEHNNLEKINKGMKTVQSLKLMIELYSKIEQVSKKRIDLKNEISKCDKVLNPEYIESLENAINNLEKLKNLLNIYQSSCEAISKKNSILKEVKYLDLIIEKNNVNVINNAKDKLSKLSELLYVKENSDKILAKRDVVVKEGVLLNKKIEEYTQKIASEVKEYEVLLAKVGKCPICNSKIDTITAKQIAQSKLNS